MQIGVDAIGTDLVVEPAALRVGQHDQHVFVHRLQELARSCNRPASAYTCLSRAIFP